MQLEFLICKMGLNIYLTELLRKLNDINGVKYSPQWLNKYKLLLLVTTTIRERYKNQKSKILDWQLPPNTWWQPPEASFFIWEFLRNVKGMKNKQHITSSSEASLTPCYIV